MEKKPPPDGGLRAISVVVGSFLCNGLIFGLVNSYSVLNDEFVKIFEGINVENARSKAALIGSLTMGTTFFLSMFAGMLSDRIGIRLTTFIGGLIISLSMLLSSFSTEKPLVLVFSYGISFGVGASLAYIPSLAIIGHYFKKYIGIANGIVTLGSSVFSMAMPYILGALVSGLGMPGCLRCLAGLLACLMLCSLIFKPYYKVKKIDIGEDTKKYFANFINLDIWKNRRYIVWVIAVPIALSGYLVPYVHMGAFIEKNFEGEDKKLPLVCIAVTSGVGRLIFGPLSDSKSVDSIFLQQLSFFVIGVISILMPFCKYYGLLLGLSLLLGIFDGCFVAVIGPIAFQFCGPEGASQAIGFILGLSSIPMTIGPPIAGWLYEHGGSYTLPFVLAGIPPILGASLLTIIHTIRVPRESNSAEWIDASKLSERTKLSSENV